jgi:dihydrofolate reductase
MDNVNLIWMSGANGIIGKDGKLPFHLPEDLKHFRELTAKSVVVMGRVTYESINPAFRPLPDRYNVILTRQKGYTVEHQDVEIIHDLEAFLLEHRTKKIWIIGGGDVYRLAMRYATALYVTTVDAMPAGDTFAPIIDRAMFRCSYHSQLLTSTTGLKYSFITWVRHRVVRYMKEVKNNKAS